MDLDKCKLITGTLVLAVFLAFFIILWAIYCKAFYLKIPLPYHYLIWPTTIVMYNITSLILTLNFLLLLIYLIFIIFLKREANFKKFILPESLFVISLIDLLIIGFSFCCRDNYYIVKIIRFISNLLYATGNLIIFFTISLIVIACRQEIYDARDKLKIYFTFDKLNLRNRLLKASFAIFLLISFCYINYGFVLNLANYNADNFIAGRPGSSEIKITTNDTDINLPKSTFILVMITEGNYVLAQYYADFPRSYN